MHKMNSIEYWNQRFATGDWISKGGATQSFQHAERFVSLLNIPRNFSGSLCDFGCAQGDAFPVYRKFFPDARLIGVDFSSCAIEEAKRKYGCIASFVWGDISACPRVDIAICAHTLEHLENDLAVLKELLRKVERVFVVVPFKERPLGKEHLRSYDETSFSQFRPRLVEITKAGWQYEGLNLLYQVYFKNLARPFFGRPIVWEPMQVIFGFSRSA